jgi:methionyl-tRNA formyltransferase
MMNTSVIPYIFFGSATFSLYVLNELEKAGLQPTIIVTTPDKPAGRGLAMTPTDVKVWANTRGIPVLDPAKLDVTFVEHLKKEIDEYENSKKNKGIQKISCCIVAAYGTIIPQTILDISPHGTLNVHPSLLPHYRGATPIQSAMLDDVKKTGVTVMRVDARMDHGPIVAQRAITVDEWPVYEVLEETLAREGGRLLAAILPDWLAGTVTEKEQNHDVATFTRKIIKKDGLIALDMKKFATNSTAIPAPIQYETFRKIQAYHQWPTAYFFLENQDGTTDNRKIRVKITSAEWRNNRLIIEKVIPEGKKETDFALCMRNH